MDKFDGILRIHPPPLATEHDSMAMVTKIQNTCHMISFKYNTGMKIAGQKFQKEERHVLLKDSMDVVFFIRNLSQNV